MKVDSVLVAGIGNIFLADDGFGVEVARRLRLQPLPDGVRVADFGIRSLHLAYELLDHRYDTTILVDAMPRGGPPGTVYLFEPDLDEGERTAPHGAAVDAHAMTPGTVFGMLQLLGGAPGHVLIVGCEPADVSERIGLSAAADKGVDEAVCLILRLLGPPSEPPGDPSHEA